MHKHLWQQAQSDKLPHALLWVGAGEDKNILIYQFAHALLCEQPQAEQACTHCKSCRLIAAQTHPDYYILMPEDKSETIGIDKIRSLTDFCEQTPQCGNKKIIIIPNANQMNLAASNALLKTLEEPAGNTYFFLSTEILATMPATIRSRCQTIRLPLHEPVAPQWQEEFFKDCELLVNKKIDPLSMAQKWQKENLLHVLMQMEIYFSNIRAFESLDKILILRKIALQHNNINAQLQLEALLTQL